MKDQQSKAKDKKLVKCSVHYKIEVAEKYNECWYVCICIDVCFLGDVFYFSQIESNSKKQIKWGSVPAIQCDLCCIDSVSVLASHRDHQKYELHIR